MLGVHLDRLQIMDNQIISAVPVPQTTSRTPCYYRDGATDKRCGMCGWCADNARWERIFQTKFADPHYYKREAHVVLQSSLGESR